MDPAQRMLASKRRFVKRLREDIATIRAQAADEVAKLEVKIRIASAIIEALEKGTLKI